MIDREEISVVVAVDIGCLSHRVAVRFESYFVFWPNGPMFDVGHSERQLVRSLSRAKNLMNLRRKEGCAVLIGAVEDSSEATTRTEN